LAIREKKLGLEHPETATSLTNLALLEHPSTNRVRWGFGRLLLAKGEPTEALACSEAALAVHEKVLGENHSWTQESARITADALVALGRVEEAVALCKQYRI
jgi:hypothetical protein